MQQYFNYFVGIRNNLEFLVIIGADPQQSIGVFDVTTGHAQRQVPNVTGGYSSGEQLHSSN